MSWLNNSFNTLKGQLTNLAQEVLQEVQASSDGEEQQLEQQQQQQFLEESLDSISQLELIEESQRRIDDLNSLCGSKDNEIALLRKQINDLQSHSSSKTVLHEDVILNETENAWRPSHLFSESMTPDERNKEELKRKVRGILNKLTPEQFDPLVDQIMKLQIDTVEKVHDVMILVFEKAIDEPNFTISYTKLCHILVKDLNITYDKQLMTNNLPIFHKALLDKAERQFKYNVTNQESKESHLRPIIEKLKKCQDPVKILELQAQLEEEEYKIRRRNGGTVRFIGELFKLSMLNGNIMRSCILLLLDSSSEDKLECLCILLTIVGKKYEETSDPKQINKYFSLKNVIKHMQNIIDRKDGNNISNRIRFMLQDVIDLRRNQWKDLPKKMDRINQYMNNYNNLIVGISDINPGHSGTDNNNNNNSGNNKKYNDNTDSRCGSNTIVDGYDGSGSNVNSAMLYDGVDDDDVENKLRPISNTSEKNEILEDSWCWEPDEVSSTQPAESTDIITAAVSTVAENYPNSETSSSGGAEIVNIPLDSPKRNRSSSDVFNQKLNKLQEENKILNETIKKLTNENDDLNRNLDELDTQHNLAIDNVLETKRDIQKKLNMVSKDYENQRKKTQEAEHKLQNIEMELSEVNNKLEKLQNVYAEYATENVFLKNKLDQSRKEFDTARNESLKFKDLLDKKGKELLELIEKVENDFGNEREEENALLKKKLHALTERLEELENEKKNFEKNSESSASSTSGKQSLDGGFIVVDDENQHTWEQKYNELLSDKSKRETEFADLERILKDWEAKYALLQAENSNFMSKIEELKSSKTVDPNRFNELKRENEQLRQDLEAANIEYMDYQDEQYSIRKELDDKILLLEDKILDLQDRNATLENENQDQISEIDNLSKGKLNDTESFEKLLTEKQKFELDVANSKFLNKELQAELNQQKLNYESKIADLENEVKILTQSRRNSPEQVPSSELIDMERLRSENETFLIKISELTEKMTKCEANASDVEAKMMIENVNLRKHISDLELALTENISDNNKLLKESSKNSIDFDDLKNWFSTYVHTDIELNDIDSIEGAFKTIKDRFWKIEVLEKNLKQMSDEILKSNSEKSKLQHDISTLNADIENYKIECEELLKNNRILLEDLENYQSSKLPAISEHNEESLVQLEKQLEDIKDLNKKLDEELKQLTQKFEETEMEKEESLAKIQSLQDINGNLKTQIENLNKQLDSMEAEKCNLIFEINEMKTDDKKSAVEAELFEHKAKISNLEQQLERLNREHFELLNSVQPQQSNLLEAKKDIERLEKLIRERDLNIVEKEKEIQKFKNEFEILQFKLIEDSSTEDDKQNLVKDLDRLENDKKRIHESLTNALKDVETSHIQIQNLQLEIEKLTSANIDLKSKDEQHSETVKHSEEELDQLRQIIKQLDIEKIDIIKTLQMKHQENLQYYNEIQRLGQLLDSMMSNEQQILKNNSECPKCKEFELDINNKNDEIEKLQEQNRFLREKSDILTTNLLTEQTNQKLIQQENKDLNEQKIDLNKDLERLQRHLVDLEDSHTQELLEMQSNMDKMQYNMKSMEEDISKSSTALTSASIRANQQAETLQAQYLLVTQQRDELATKISLAEDRELKNQAALVNLQCALEQFQKEKQKDIDLATAKIRKELKYEKDVQNALKTEISGLKDQLTEANQGLLAASRISDQLEGSKETIVRLKEEIERLENESSKLKEKINTSESSQADKIEKSLIKSLIIGYIVSSNVNDKNQILKVITTVLDFDQIETDKLGLNKQQLGWFGSLLGAGPTQEQNKDSLAEAFVHFLERESQPRNDPKKLPNLLNIVSENPNSTAKERKYSQTSTTSSTSVTGNIRNTSVQPILLNDNVLSDFAPTRNSSSILKDILSDS